MMRHIARAIAIAAAVLVICVSGGGGGASCVLRASSGQAVFPHVFPPSRNSTGYALAAKSAL